MAIYGIFPVTRGKLTEIIKGGKIIALLFKDTGIISRLKRHTK
jgi:hypothetical protein